MVVGLYPLVMFLSGKVRCLISYKDYIGFLLQTLQRVDLLRKRLLDYGKNCASVCAKVENLEHMHLNFVVGL